MKSIQIKSLRLLNFKGIKNLEVNDFGKETNIFGDNGTGKTTIFDAFTWLMFGKNSQDQTTFEIKTLDSNNNVIEKIDHEVEATLIIDGELVNIKRTLREKWVTKRGSADAEFSGNETVYHWNDVPMLAKDFTSKVNAIIDDSVFKMITNPLAFNSLKWQDQRQVLLEITGGVSDEDVADGNSEFGQLLSKLSNKSLEEYQKQVAASIKKSKQEIKMIPTRIDEVERGKPEALDFASIEKQITSLEKERDHVDAKMSGKLEAQQALIDEKKEIRSEINKLDIENSDLIHEAEKQARQEFQQQSSGDDVLITQANEIKAKIRNAKESINRHDSTVLSLEKEAEYATSRMNYFRKEWIKRNAEEFQMSESDSACPTCLRDFDADKVEQKRKEAEEQFKLNKSRDLANINDKGSAKKKEFESLENQISEVKTEIEAYKNELSAHESKYAELASRIETPKDVVLVSKEAIKERLLSGNAKIKDNKVAIASLQQKLEGLDVVDVSELKSVRDQFTINIKSLSEGLSVRAQIVNANQRVEQLKDQEKVLAQEIANEEREQFTIENFIKAKIDRLELLINDKFDMVKFKMFETQINGGQTETCKALIDGVPFNDANTASKINAGIDIINTLCNHYGVHAPIFIDNRESVVQLLPTESQVVNLIVSEADKKLRIEASKSINELETV